LHFNKIFYFYTVGNGFLMGERGAWKHHENPWNWWDEFLLHHLLEAYSAGQTLSASYEKLEKCCQWGNEKVFKFKIHLEELFCTLEDEPSELAKTAKFVSGLQPSLNRKLRGKEYSSLAHAVEAAQIEERCLGEAERRMHEEDQEQHGKWRELPWTKELPTKDLGKADQKVPGKLKAKSANKPGKGCWNCGKVGHIQTQCPEQLTKSSNSCFILVRTVAPGWPSK